MNRKLYAEVGETTGTNFAVNVDDHAPRKNFQLLQKSPENERRYPGLQHLKTQEGDISTETKESQKKKIA